MRFHTQTHTFCPSTTTATTQSFYEKKDDFIRTWLDQTKGITIPPEENALVFLISSYLNRIEINAQKPLEIIADLMKAGADISLSVNELNQLVVFNNNRVHVYFLFAFALFTAVSRQSYRDVEGADVQLIVSLLTEIVKKADTKTLNGLSVKVTEGEYAGQTPWFYLMYALFEATCGTAQWVKNVKRIVSLLSEIVKKVDTETLHGLSEKATEGRLAGYTPWLYIMDAFYETHDRTLANFQPIFSLLSEIVKKADAKTLKGLSEKAIAHRSVHKTPWLYVMYTLSSAAGHRSWMHVQFIISLLSEIVKKVDTETLNGLSEKIRPSLNSGYDGFTPWLYLTHALSSAVDDRSWKHVQLIISLLSDIVKKADVKTLKGLSEKKISSERNSKTPWFYVVCAVKEILEKGQKFPTFIIAIFEKFDTELAKQNKQNSSVLDTDCLWKTMLIDLPENLNNTTFTIVEKLLENNLFPSDHFPLQAVSNKNMMGLLLPVLSQAKKIRESDGIQSHVVARMTAHPDTRAALCMITLTGLVALGRLPLEISMLCAEFLLTPHQDALLNSVIYPNGIADISNEARISAWKFLCVLRLQYYVNERKFGIFSKNAYANRASALCQEIGAINNPILLYALLWKQYCLLKHTGEVGYRHPYPVTATKEFEKPLKNKTKKDSLTGIIAGCLRWFPLSSPSDALVKQCSQRILSVSP